MKYYTWCNIIDHPKLAVLEKSAKAFNIHINVLGKGVKWERNFQKVGLLLEAIEGVDENELILCTDAFDVLYLQNQDAILKAYQAVCSANKSGAQLKLGTPDAENMQNPIVFSAERLYSHHYPKYKAYWDAIKTPFGYKYLNSGTFIGYQKNLVQMLKQILKDAHNYTEKSDQKLYAEYAVKNPGKIILDYRCELFWCSAGEQEIMHNLYKIDNNTQNANITVGNALEGFPSGKLKNLKTNQTPCLIHITHSKGFYDQLLKIAVEMGFVNNNQRDKYWKLHKKSLALLEKKPKAQKSSPLKSIDEKKGDKNKKAEKKDERKGDRKDERKDERKGESDRKDEKSEKKAGKYLDKKKNTKTFRPESTKIPNKMGIREQKSFYRRHVDTKNIPKKLAIDKKRRHHLISNGRVISECTTCYSSPHQHTSKKSQTSYNGGRFPSYF